MISKLRHFIIEKSFSSCLEYILSIYSKVSPKDRVECDGALDILSYWKDYELQSYKMSLQDIKKKWDDFDEYILTKGLLKHYPIIAMVAQSIMLDIKEKLPHENILVTDQKPFQDKLLYSKVLLWSGNIKEALSYLSALTRRYENEAEPWALLGRIYCYLKQREKSLLFYREAFFINPTVLNLTDIRSSFLDDLIFLSYELLGLEKGITNKESFVQWIGIYGISYQFFNQRKELTKIEEETMQKRLSVYEKIYAKNADEQFLNLLRLIVFCYDYHQSKGETLLSKKLIDKIEILSPTVYRKLLP